MRLVRSLLLVSSLIGMAIGVAAVPVPALGANDPHAGKQWNMEVIGAEEAWAKGTGKGITIAVVDTGVHLTHEDFASGKLVGGRDFVTPNTTPQDDNGHGTHVAGIAAASTNNGLGVAGVAPDARIMPVKVLDGDGNGSYTNIAGGIRWAVDNGAHVVNLSLGSTTGSLFGNPESFEQAITYAWSKGVLCVVAAGNDFVLGSGFGDEPALVVSATDRHDRKPTYSNGVGSAQWGLAAPGGSGGVDLRDDVFSTFWPHTQGPFTFDPYEYLAGTSMAAPHVAGAAAVLRSMGLTPQQTVDRLLATAKDLGSAGKDATFGHGRLDLAKAVAGLGGAGGGGGGGVTTTTATTSSTARRGGNTGTTGGSAGGTAGGTSGGTATGESSEPARGAGGAATLGGGGGADGEGSGDGHSSGNGASDGTSGDVDAIQPEEVGGGGGGDSDSGGNAAPWVLALAAALLLGGIGAAAVRATGAPPSAGADRV